MLRFLRLFPSFVDQESANMRLSVEAQSLRDRLAYAENEATHWRAEYSKVNEQNSLLLKSMVNEKTQRENGTVRFPEAHHLPANLAGPQPGPSRAGSTIRTTSQMVERLNRQFFQEAKNPGRDSAA